MKRELEDDERPLEVGTLQFYLVAQEILDEASHSDDVAWEKASRRIRMLMLTDKSTFKDIMTNRVLWSRMLEKLVTKRRIPVHLPLLSVDTMSTKEMTRVLARTKTAEQVYRYCFAPVIQVEIMTCIAENAVEILPLAGCAFTDVNEYFWGKLSPWLNDALWRYSGSLIWGDQAKAAMRPLEEWSEEATEDTLTWLLNYDFLQRLQVTFGHPMLTPEKEYEIADDWTLASRRAALDFWVILEKVLRRLVGDAQKMASMRQRVNTLLRMTLNFSVNALQEADNAETIVSQAALPFSYRLFWYLADKYGTGHEYATVPPNKKMPNAKGHQMFHAPQRPACLACGESQRPLLREATAEGAYFCSAQCQEACRL